MSDEKAAAPHDCEAEKVGVEMWGVYDGVLFWQCGVCTRRWHRFPEGHMLRRLAARFVEGVAP